MNLYRRERLIEIAKSLQHLRTGRSLHCAFILNKNKLLCYAVNSYSKENLHYRFGQYVGKYSDGFYKSGRHAEAEALRYYISKFGNNDMSRLTLFVTRISKNGDVMESKPCFNCERNIIIPNNFKEVLWT